MPILEEKEWTPEEKAQVFASLSEFHQVALENLLDPIRKMNEAVRASLLPIALFQDTIKSFPNIDFAPTPRIFQSENKSKNITRAKMGLNMSPLGIFKYKRHILKKLSRKNSEGRLLALFFKNREPFASLEDIRKEFRFSDSVSLSWILRNLKNKFKENGLVLYTEKVWNPDGYIITEIKYLQ